MIGLMVEVSDGLINLLRFQTAMKKIYYRLWQHTHC